MFKTRRPAARSPDHFTRNATCTQMTAVPVCSASREFSVSSKQVFDAFVDPARLARWWAAPESTIPVCEFEARPGGGIRIETRAPNGAIQQLIGAVEEIEAPGKLIFTSAALDETGRALSKVRTEVSIEDAGGRASLSLQAWVIQKSGSGAEFQLAEMRTGWAQSLERLGDLLGTSGQDGEPAEVIGLAACQVPAG